MDEVVISLSFEELDVLKRLVKEKIAIWNVHAECSRYEIAKEHCRFEMACYKSLLKSLED